MYLQKVEPSAGSSGKCAVRDPPLRFLMFAVPFAATNMVNPSCFCSQPGDEGGACNHNHRQDQHRALLEAQEPRRQRRVPGVHCHQQGEEPDHHPGGVIYGTVTLLNPEYMLRPTSTVMDIAATVLGRRVSFVATCLISADLPRRASHLGLSFHAHLPRTPLSSGALLGSCA